MTVLLVNDLTTAALNGTGIFDVLMRANKVHLEAEFKAGRFKGAEYSTVYLGTLQPVLQTAMAFLVQNQEAAQKALLLEQQILLATLAVQKAQIEKDALLASLAKIPAEIAQLEAQTALVVQQKLNTIDELLTSTAQRSKITADIAQSTAQTTHVSQQTSNLVAEAFNIPKQGTVLTNQGAQIAQQTANLVSESLGIAAKTAQTTQQTTNLAAEAFNIPKQGLLLDAQKDQSVQQVVNLAAEKLAIDAKASLTVQQTESEALRNFIDPVDATKSGTVDQERRIAVATECKLRSEFDLTMANVTKAASENAFVLQKKATEQAQTVASGVDVDSVVGRQKALYAGQADGFKRDAEQKAAQILVETWKVRRTTDEATVADATNKLNDATIGSAVTKLLTGAGV